MSKGGKDVIRKELEEENVTVEDGELIENAVKISDYDFLYRLRAFREGKCYVQDESSMLCAKLAGAKEGQFVMDLCSAPGGKSLYTADQMKGSGQVLSRDLTEYKTDLIEDNIERMGFTNMEAEVFDATILDEEHIEAADVVIADVPCSLTTICWANVLTDKNNPTMNISRTLNVAFLFMSLYINALILFILFGKIPIENYSTFLLAFL